MNVLASFLRRNKKTLFTIVFVLLILPASVFAGNKTVCVAGGICSESTGSNNPMGNIPYIIATPNPASINSGQVVTVSVTEVMYAGSTPDFVTGKYWCNDPAATTYVDYGTGFPSSDYAAVTANSVPANPVPVVGKVTLSLQSPHPATPSGEVSSCPGPYTYKGTFTVKPTKTTDYTVWSNNGGSLGGTVSGISYTASVPSIGYAWFDTFEVTVNKNNPPNAPTLTCPATLGLNTDGNFSAVATDPDGDQIDYGLDFDGDGTQDVWLPFYGWVNSGTKETWTNSWDTSGTYSVGAFTRDSNLANSTTWGHCSVTVQPATGAICGKTFNQNGVQANMGTTITVAGVGSYSGSSSYNTGQINTGSYKVTAGALSGYTRQYCVGASCNPVTGANAVTGSSYTASVTGGNTTCVNWGYVVAPASPPVTATCNATNSQLTLSWSAVSKATFYDVTADDASTAASPDHENDNYTSTSITYPVTAGHSITYSVDAGNAGATSDPTVGTVVCGDPDLTATAGVGTQIASGHTEPMTGTVKNSGTDTTGVGFYSQFEWIQGVDTSNITYGANIWSGALAAGGSKAMSGNTTAFTVTATTTFRYRLCADTTNRIADSNENNNCSTWVAFQVTPPPPVQVNLVCTPSTVSPGDSATLSWSSSGATKCTSSDFSTGNSTSGSVSTGAIATSTSNTYNISCTGAGGSDTDSCTVSSVLPDLIPVGVKNYTVNLGDAIPITGVVKNDGATTTGRNFNDIIMTNLSADGTTWGTMRLASVSPMLDVGTSHTFNGTFLGSTFTAPGTYKWRYCVDNNTNWVSLVAESDETNNCSAQGTIKVVPAPLTGGTCSVSKTSIYAGTAVTWTVSGVTGGTAPYTYAWTDDATGQSIGTTNPLTYTYTDAGPTTESATVVITSADGQTQTEDCGGNVDGDGNTQTPVTVSVKSCKVTLSPSIQTVDLNTAPTFSWSVSPAGCAAACVFTGDNISVPNNKTNYQYPNAITSVPSTQPVAYDLECPSNVPAQTAEADVYVNVPEVHITANPSRVKASTDGTPNTTITWTANNVATSTGSCTVYDNGTKDWAIPVLDDDGNTTASGNSKTASIAIQNVFKIDCQGPFGGDVTDQTIVNILPSFEEF